MSVSVLILFAATVAQPAPAELVARAAKGPSLLFAPAEIPAVRARLAGNADAKAWWSGFRADLDARLAEPVCVPTRGGQWAQWMTCKACGGKILSKSPTNHVCEACSAAYSGWPYDDCYLSEVHYLYSGQVRACGIAYLMTGERRYAARAREILLGYAAAYGKYVWHGHDGPVDGPGKWGARVFAELLDEARWLIPMLEGYDCVAGALTADERRTICERLFRPSAETIRSQSFEWSNHEVWHLVAYGLAGLVVGDVRYVDEALHSKYGALNQLDHGILADGLWHEGTLHYHYFTMKGLTLLFRALRNLGYAVPENYRKMFSAPFGQLTPDGALPAVNDTLPERFAPGDHPEQYEMANAWWDDPLYAWWIAQQPRNNEPAALWGRDRAVTRAPKPLSSALLGESGLAVLRSQTPGRIRSGIVPDNCLMMDFGPHGGWHGHPDKLNVFFWLHGRAVTEDPGCIRYGNPRHWGWYRSTLAHNTVRIDGRNQGYSTCDLLAFETNAERSVVVASFSGSRPKKVPDDGPVAAGVDGLRMTALVGDVVLDYFEVSSDAEHDYEWCFHARGEVSLPGEFRPMTGLTPRFNREHDPGWGIAGTDAWSWVEHPMTARHAGRWQATWRDGKGLLHLAQKSSVPGELETGTADGLLGGPRVALAVNKVRARRAAFASVFVADDRNAAVSIDEVYDRPDGTRGFAATVNGRKYVLSQPKKGETK